MHIHFNHTISCVGDMIRMIRTAHPDVTVSASHAREDHGLDDVLDKVTVEMAANPDGSMPDGYVDWLIQTAGQNGADVVIPYRHRIDLSAHASAFSNAGMRLLTSGPKSVMEMIEDKPALLTFAQSMGLPVSPFRVWNDAASFSAALDQFGFADGSTLCIKPSHGIYGEGFKVLYDETAPHAFANAVKVGGPRVGAGTLYDILKRTGPVGSMMMMPFLPGIERSVDFACLDGRLLAAVTREKHGRVQHISHNPESFAFARDLTFGLRLSGIVNLQTLEDSAGRQHLLEINSRAAGGIGMTQFGGVNLLGVMMSALKGEDTGAPVVPQQRVNVKSSTVYTTV